MAFFNKKEEVLDLKLTPHGRYLLSIGKLKPAYYCFVDDDVIYDSQAMGYSETQNESQKRIVDDTPKLKSIGVSCGVQTSYGEMESSDINIDSMRVNNSETKVNKYPYYLGNNSYDSDKVSTLHVNMLNNEINSSSHYYTGSVYHTGSTTDSNGFEAKEYLSSEILNIPQLNVEIDYKIYVEKLRLGERQPIVLDSELSQVYPDGTYYKVKADNPLAHFKEFNSFNHKKNFKIEVFEMDETDENIPKYKKLKFQRQYETIVNGMLVGGDVLYNDDPEAGDGMDLSMEMMEADNAHEFVEYYFDILVDNEIDQRELCKYIEHATSNDIFVDEDLECPDERTERFDIYGTRVSPSDLERCD